MPYIILPLGEINERRNIFENDHNRNFFIQTLKESLNTYKVILYSFAEKLYEK